MTLQIGIGPYYFSIWQCSNFSLNIWKSSNKMYFYKHIMDNVTFPLIIEDIWVNRLFNDIDPSKLTLLDLTQMEVHYNETISILDRELFRVMIDDAYIKYKKNKYGSKV